MCTASRVLKYILCVLTQITTWDWHCTGEVMKHGSKLNSYISGSVRGGSSGSIEPLDSQDMDKNKKFWNLWVHFWIIQFKIPMEPLYIDRFASPGLILYVSNARSLASPCLMEPRQGFKDDQECIFFILNTCKEIFIGGILWHNGRNWKYDRTGWQMDGQTRNFK